MSLSIDFTAVMNQAFTIANQLWPVFAVPLGIILGFAILDKVLKAVRGAFGSH